MKKILIADDSLFMRKVLRDIIEDLMPSQGSRVTILEADCAWKTLKEYEKEKPDLILLDIVMPEGELAGINVLREVMRLDSNANVIMITAVGQDAVIQECQELGAKDHIVKPFNQRRIVQVVQRYLG